MPLVIKGFHRRGGLVHRLSVAARSRPTGDAAKAAHRDSVLHHSPVDGDVRARDRRGPVSGEPCDDIGDFLGS